MYIALAVLILLLIGFINYMIKKNENNTRAKFLVEFKSKFHDYANSYGQDNSAYSWLIQRSNKMQNQMGSQGILDSFKPPYANYMYNNYPIILNMIPSMHEDFKGHYLRRQAQQYARTIDEALIRYYGSLVDENDFLQKKIRNPASCFQEGIKQIVGIPIYILGLFGIMNSKMVGAIISSGLFSILSGIITLTGFVSAVLSLVVGWDDFLLKVQQFFN